MDVDDYCAANSSAVQVDSSRYVPALIVFASALALRQGEGTPSFDELYHLKRIAAFPSVLEFDPGRGIGGAWCPWPPLYDFACGAMARLFGIGAVELLPPLAIALLAAWLAIRYGWVAGAAVALSPFLVGVSRAGRIDHHWAEAILVVAIVEAVARRSAIGLTAALVAAMFVQPALIVAAAVAFVFVRRERCGAIAFGVTAAAIAVYRLTRPEGYPDSPWFLGWPHAALFAAMGVLSGAPAASPVRPPLTPARPPALHRVLLAIALLLAALPQLLAGVRFFGGDPWLTAIVEFQPMFRDPAAIGTHLANVTAALLAFAIVRRHRVAGVFGIIYVLLSLTSRRFLAAGVPLFAIAAGIAASSRDRRLAIAAMLLAIAPPLAYHIGEERTPPARSPALTLAEAVRPLPPGRVLAPWWAGHAIDVVGRHAVVIDNFGSMPGEILFGLANDALRQRHPDRLRAWCRERGIRYLALPPGPAARGTVWWRLRSGERLPGFRRHNRYVWEVE